MKELPKTYDPQGVEKALYQRWEESGCFTAKRAEGKTPFCSMMPPPNITGELHLGHAMNNTLQDILARFHRMKGDPTLWLPGTDHASIATEVKVVEALAKQGISKASLGREKFLDRVWEWRDEFGGTIVRQLRCMGSSCDWSRERFTMDEGCSKAVREVFVRYYSEGLIYRGERIINWCPKCKTALSDAEVEFEEKQGHIWHIRYPGPDGTSIIVATTRPETMLGDTAVAVNPNDERYRHLVGKTVTLPLRDRPIPVVADDYVEMDFGTGAVKITPAHDPNDFEVAMRHSLPIDRVMHDDGTMTEACGPYASLSGLEARKRVVADLEALGLLVKIEDYKHNVGQCYRCDCIVEPLVSKQWFVRMKPLAEPAIEAVRSGKITFVPERFEKLYYNWMENIRDWCISRQLWWGHRIPAWHCDACGHIAVAINDVTVCPECGGEVRQDEDVLDTWFSSALWPFSTLGWPDNTDDLKFFYPTTVLVTGFDIIFFWVARMIFSGLHLTKEIPFSHVLMHGLVRDEHGHKMSKSRGNGVDPLELVDKYGADALRFALIIGVAPGNDMRISHEKLESMRNFGNKIWNAARFVMMNLEGMPSVPPCQESLSHADKWIKTRLAAVSAEITEHLTQYDTGLAAQKIYDFIWSEFCDWYIEMAKWALNEGDETQKAAAQWTLLTVLSSALKLLHPFMPFITTEIYDALPSVEGELMLSSWPENLPTYPAEAQTVETGMEVIRAIRNLRAEMNVQPGRRASLYLLCAPNIDLSPCVPYFKRLAAASEVTMLANKASAPANAAAAICTAAEAYLPLGELVDVAKERARLQKERDALIAEISRGEAKLQNPGFTAKAPANLVEEERKKLDVRRAMLCGVEERLNALDSM